MKRLLFAAIAISFYGGGFAAIPAYLKDMFGGLQVSAIHGRLLTAWSAAGIVGPLIVNSIADHQKAAGRAGAELYAMSLLVMAGLLVVGFVANLLVRPVATRWHEPEASVPGCAPDEADLSEDRFAAATAAAKELFVSSRAGVGAKAVAGGLWVVVGGGLAYGLVTTIIKAVALFA